MSVQTVNIHPLVNGFVGLCASRKGVAFLLTLVITTILSLTNHLTPTFAAVVGTIFSIFSISHSYVNATALNASSQVQQTINQIKDKV